MYRHNIYMRDEIVLLYIVRLIRHYVKVGKFMNKLLDLGG